MSSENNLSQDAIPDRPYLRDEVYNRLRKYVAEVSAASVEEVPLREADLTRALGVSRTPIREALNRLQQEGLIVLLPRRGVRVKPTSLSEYMSWLEIRETLDGIAARGAAQRATATAIAGMRKLFESFTEAELATVSSNPEFSDANAKFHAAICAESGNSVLPRMYAAYHYVDTTRRLIVNQPGLLARSLREHRAIIDAIEARDSDLAEQLARAHVRSVRKWIEQSLAASGSAS
jgi:DNA-binding GntR family transcriptional regulator